jgi:hypothetical protein
MKQLIKQLATEDIKSIELADHNEWKWFRFSVERQNDTLYYLEFRYKPTYNYEHVGDGVFERREVISETLSYVAIEHFETNIDITERDVVELIEV